MTYKTVLFKRSNKNKKHKYTITYSNKTHMVTKRTNVYSILSEGLILAKIHMVTKQWFKMITMIHCLILAKIHMVTKHKTLW